MVVLFSLGLDEIISEKESPALSRQRKATTKGAEDKKLTDEDEDYEPKLTPGCYPSLNTYFLSSVKSQ